MKQQKTVKILPIIRKLNKIRAEQKRLTLNRWLKTAGLPSSTYYRWLAGSTTPSLGSLEKLANALNVEVDLKISPPATPLK